MAILRFLKWRPPAILDFRNSNFSTIWTVKRPILHNHAKFREDRSICCCDIAIFVIFQDGCGRHLVFEKLEILKICPLYGANLRKRAKFHQINQTVAEIWRLNGFYQNGDRNFKNQDGGTKATTYNRR